MRPAPYPLPQAWRSSDGTIHSYSFLCHALLVLRLLFADEQRASFGVYTGTDRRDEYSSCRSHRYDRHSLLRRRDSIASLPTGNRPYYRAGLQTFLIFFRCRDYLGGQSRRSEYKLCTGASYSADQSNKYGSLGPATSVIVKP